jgi:hypothetical protein
MRGKGAGIRENIRGGAVLHCVQYWQQKFLANLILYHGIFAVLCTLRPLRPSGDCCSEGAENSLQFLSISYRRSFSMF